ASHELKTPLASIRLLTDSILQSDQIDMATTKEFVADIGDEAQRLSRITEALLVLTRLDDGQEVPSAVLDLRDSVRDAAHLLEPVAREREVTLHLELEERCPVRSNEDDLYQILFNLMENAIKYNLPGGSVTVSVWQMNDRVQLRVEDTGIGIPEADRDKVFDRFFRVDKARSRAAGGTGLGLSIVWDTVKRWGGDITLGPGVERGTWFLVTFPLAQEETL
ncbi:MAG: HAMP domain-containing histidine kinase, partial [Clostridiales bacterium]|nr:HAMP domain-containing histidine kinase [Clostridiales bacterium]